MMQVEIEPVEIELAVFEDPQIILGSLVTLLSRTLSP